MFDRIKFRIKEPISLEKGNFVGKTKNRTKYSFYNEFNPDAALCKIAYLKKEDYYLVDVNIRKFYFGKYSIEDLTLDSFERALYQLAKSINVEIATLLNAEIYFCEIGLSVKTRVSCDKIINRIRKYKGYQRNLYDDESVTFISAAKNIKIYDKVVEINRRMDEDKAPQLKKDDVNNDFSNKNYLRLELQLKNRNGFKEGVFKNIKTLNDLVTYYYLIYEAYCMYISRIRFSYTAKDFDGVELKKLEYFVLKHEDPYLIIDEYIKDVTKSLTGPKLYKKKSFLKKEFNDIMEKAKYSTKYKKESLMADVFIAIKNRKELDVELKVKKLLLILCSQKIIEATTNI